MHGSERVGAAAPRVGSRAALSSAAAASAVAPSRRRNRSPSRAVAPQETAGPATVASDERVGNRRGRLGLRHGMDRGHRPYRRGSSRPRPRRARGGRRGRGHRGVDRADAVSLGAPTPCSRPDPGSAGRAAAAGGRAATRPPPVAASVRRRPASRTAKAGRRPAPAAQRPVGPPPLPTTGPRQRRRSLGRCVVTGARQTAAPAASLLAAVSSRRLPTIMILNRLLGDIDGNASILSL